MATIAMASTTTAEVKVVPNTALAGKEPTPPATEYTLPKLPYAYDALEPHLDAKTMELHYTRHHNVYVSNLNAAVKNHPELFKKSVEDLLRQLDQVPEDIRLKVRNFGGGHANHSFFWKTLAKTDQHTPKGELLEAINKQFTSFDNFKTRFLESAVGLFGSGWTWLTMDASKALRIRKYSPIKIHR